LIFVVPYPGMSALESRGIEMIWIFLFLGSTRATISESERCCDSPGRVSEPIRTM